MPRNVTTNEIHELSLVPARSLGEGVQSVSEFLAHSTTTFYLSHYTVYWLMINLNLPMGDQWFSTLTDFCKI